MGRPRSALMAGPSPADGPLPHWEVMRCATTRRRDKPAMTARVGSLIGRQCLDILSLNGVQRTNLAPLPGRWPGDSVRRGECGSRGLRLVTSALGRLGQDTPDRHHDRSAGAISLGWDFEARVMPASDAWKAVAGFRVMCCDALRLSNHRDVRSELVPGSRVARAERWRSVAAASAVVERREASGPRAGRAGPVRARRLRNTPFGVPLSFSSLRGAFATKQSRLCAADPGLLRRFAPRNDED